MMVLSRIWYVILSLVLGVALYVVFLAVGEYNRGGKVAMTEELASDSQVVGWALQIDARHRLDALLYGSVDPGVQGALTLAQDKDKIPPKAKEDARKGLLGVNEKIPAEYKSDALFAVDHDGRVVAQIGFDQANAFEDFELGGYAAVFDALHGYLRDDTWVLGGKIYRVAARPVENGIGEKPLGAVVGFRLVDNRFAGDIAKRTRANVAFYAAGQRVASAATEGFDASSLEQVVTLLPKLAQDKSYADGRSEVQTLGDDASSLGAIFARLPGDAWETGAGFAVARSRVALAGPLGFLNSADDKDKQGVSWGVLVAAILLGILGGIGFSVLEQTLPMREMTSQAARLKRGELDYLQLPRFSGGYRGIAADINAGIERVLEKGGGAARKPADLESILGPVPQQPAMSAFSFPLADNGSAAGPPQRPGGPPAFGGGPPGREPFPTRPGAPGGPQQGVVSRPGFPSAQMSGPPPYPHPGGMPGQAQGAALAMPQAGPPIPPPFQNVVHAPPSAQYGGSDADADGPTMAAAQSPATAPLPGFAARAPTMVGIGLESSGNPPAPRAPAPAPAAGQAPVAYTMPTAPNAFFPPGRAPAPGSSSTGPVPKAPPPSAGVPLTSSSGRQLPDTGEDEQDEATVVAPAPSELIAAASGANPAAGESAEWLNVYDDFVRTKKQCGEPTEGLTFEKFQHTLKKNRDALIQRHGCKRVRFSVYVKEGRASLKATPVRE